MTKIKDSFAIFKNLVLEARANGGDGSGGVNRESGANLNEETTQLLQQIKDLKSCLLQRDNEIAILVNMVKKERANAESNEHRIFDERTSREATSKESESEVSFPVIKQSANRRNDGKAKVNSSAPISTAEREALRSEKIIKKHLFGVPPPEDRSLFEDMAGEESEEIYFCDQTHHHYFCSSLF